MSSIGATFQLGQNLANAWPSMAKLSMDKLFMTKLFMAKLFIDKLVATISLNGGPNYLRG